MTTCSTGHKKFINRFINKIKTYFPSKGSNNGSGYKTFVKTTHF